MYFLCRLKAMVNAMEVGTFAASLSNDENQSGDNKDANNQQTNQSHPYI